MRDSCKWHGMDTLITKMKKISSQVSKLWLQSPKRKIKAKATTKSASQVDLEFKWFKTNNHHNNSNSSNSNRLHLSPKIHQDKLMPR